MINDNDFNKYLNKVRFNLLSSELFKQTGFFTFFFIFLIFTCFILDYIYDFKTNVRIFLSPLMFLTFIVITSFIIYKLRKKYLYWFKNNRRILKYLEKNHKSSKTVLQFYDLLKQKNNPFLKQAKEQIYQKILDNNYLFVPKLKFPLKVLLIFLPLFLLTFTDGKFFFKKMIFFTKELRRPVTYSVKLKKNHYEKPYQDTLSIIASLKGRRIPEKLSFIKEDQNSKKIDTTEVKVNEKQNLETVLKAEESCRFYFTDGNVLSDTGYIKVIHYPKIMNISAKVIFPEYSSLPSKNYNGESYLSEILYGSKVEFSVTTQNSDTLLIKENEIIKKYTGKNNLFEFSLQVIKNSTLEFSTIRDTFISKNKQEIQIEAILDQYPQCEIILPEEGSLLNEDFNINVLGLAEDDFKITNVSLTGEKLLDNSFLKGIGLNLKSPKITERLSLSKLNEGRYAAKGQINLKKLNLLPEDRIKIFITAYDNDLITGPKKTKSREVIIKVPSVDELFKESTEKISTQTDSIKKIEKEANSFSKMLKELSENVKIGKKINYEQKEALAEALKREQKLLETGSKIEKELDEGIKKLADKKLLDQETLQKYGKLKNLLNELMKSSLADKLKKLMNQDKDQKFDKNEMAKALDQMQMEQNKFKEGLKKALNILEKLKFEQNLQALIKSYEDLHKQQDKINNELENQSAEKILTHTQKQEQKLQKNHQEIGDLSELLKKFEAENSNRLENKLKKIQQISADLTKKKLSMKFRQKWQQGENSLETGKELADSLESIHDQLSKLKEELLTQEKAKYTKIINELANLTLYLSFKTEELSTSYKSLSTASSTATSLYELLTADISLFEKLTEVVKNIAQETFFIDNRVIGTIYKIDETYRKGIDKATRKNFPKTAKELKTVMGEYNYLTVSLINIAKNINNAQSSTGFEEMMKKLEELAKKQQNLNNQSKSMMQSGQQAMPGMGQSSGKSGQQMMNDLAEQQLSLQKEMEKLMQQYSQNPGDNNSGDSGTPKPGENGKPGSFGEKNQQNSGLGKKLGDFSGKMQDIANRMKNKIFDKTTKKMQEKLLYAMLKTVKSYRQKEESKKREAEKADLVHKLKTDPALFYKDSLKIMLEKSLMDGYTPKYRKLIKQYFKQ